MNAPIPNPADPFPFHAAHLQHTLGALAHLDRVMFRSPADANRNGAVIDSDEEIDSDDDLYPTPTRQDRADMWADEQRQREIDERGE